MEKQYQELLKRQHLKSLIKIRVEQDEGGIPQLAYEFDEQTLHALANTYLGKTLLVTTRSNWSDARIIEAYRSQYQIENIFKEMKDTCVGNWWPLQHWTDSKIRVHGLYCTMAVLWRALMMRRLARSRFAPLRSACLCRVEKNQAGDQSSAKAPGTEKGRPAGGFYRGESVTESDLGRT